MKVGWQSLATFLPFCCATGWMNLSNFLSLWSFPQSMTVIYILPRANLRGIRKGKKTRSSRPIRLVRHLFSYSYFIPFYSICVAGLASVDCGFWDRKRLHLIHIMLALVSKGIWRENKDEEVFLGIWSWKFKAKFWREPFVRLFLVLANVTESPTFYFSLIYLFTFYNSPVDNSIDAPALCIKISVTLA